jgi:GrpB-like predicted nucleotidyltransferase (UPF0157 family)
LDIAVGVDLLGDIETVANRLSLVGLRDRGIFGNDGGVRLLQRVCSDGRIVLHVHILTTQEANWQRYLKVRNFLLANKHARDIVATRKRELAERFTNDRSTYSKYKSALLSEYWRD